MEPMPADLVFRACGACGAVTFIEMKDGTGAHGVLDCEDMHREWHVKLAAALMPRWLPQGVRRAS